MRSLLTKIRTFGLGVMSLVWPGLALAQPQAQVSETRVKLPLLDLPLFQIINNVISIILVIAGVLVLAYLIYGGFVYITAGGDTEQASKGRVAITNSIIGVILIAAAFAILRFIVGRVQ